jgi:hypothetical protein
MAAPARLLRAAAIVAVTLGVSASGLLAGLATPGLATTVTVTTTADTPPPCPGNAVSLRCAISTANQLGSSVTIAFAIQGGDAGCTGTPIVCTIAPTGALPPLTAGDTAIDGYTQPGSAPNDRPFSGGSDAILAVRLAGSDAGVGVSGLVIEGPNDTVRGLAITGFLSCSICGPIPGQITGGDGVEVRSTGDVVTGNFLGVAPDGVTAAPNEFAGVHVLGSGAAGARIGGTDPASTNVLSGNKQCTLGDCEGFGAYVDATGPGTIVQRNLIGTTASGQARLANAATGLVVLARQTIITGNVISGSGGDGVLTGASAVTLSQNLIGTDPTGRRGIENHSHGVDVQGSGNRVLANVISHNGDTGLVLSATNTVVRGNHVGTDVAGKKALANGFDPSAIFLGQPINGTDGIVICGSNNVVGGAALGQGNVVGGNVGDGIFVGSGGNVVQGNKVGTDGAGMKAIPNQVDGIGSDFQGLLGVGFCFQGPSGGGSNNTIGGTAAGAGNLVSGNLVHGIDLVAAQDHTIANNLVGTDATGIAALGNGGVGVILGPLCDEHGCTPSSGNQVTGNIVSANGSDGIDVIGTGGGTGNVIAGNRIGTDLAGHPTLGNGGAGMRMTNDASGDVVGGTVPSAANVIAGNAGPGVLIGSDQSDTGTHVAVQGNATFANGGLGIDLAPEGVVDCSTAPPGPNGYVPCPVITSASTTTVTGTGCPGCTIEVFRALVGAGDSGHGEGGKFLSRTVAAGNGAWSVSLTLASGTQVTATATTAPSTVPPQTSEFGANVTVV